MGSKVHRITNDILKNIQGTLDCIKRINNAREPDIIKALPIPPRPPFEEGLTSNDEVNVILCEENGHILKFFNMMKNSYCC